MNRGVLATLVVFGGLRTLLPEWSKPGGEFGQDAVGIASGDVTRRLVAAGWLHVEGGERGVGIARVRLGERLLEGRTGRRR